MVLEVRKQELSVGQGLESQMVMTTQVLVAESYRWPGLVQLHEKSSGI